MKPAPAGPRTLRTTSAALGRELREARTATTEPGPIEFRQLYETAPVAWLVLDTYAIIRDINPAGAAALGGAAAFIVGTPLRMWMDDTGRGPVLEHIRRCRSGEAAAETEAALRPRDGRRRIFRLTSGATHVRGHLLFPTMMIEITEQVELEQARRLAEQQRDRAEEERRAAQAAEAAKDRLIATVSHELRNPLSPALIAATTLEAMAGLPDAARRMAHTIKRNIEIEARLIDDLLDVARATRGQMTLRRATVDVHDILKYAAEACASAARERHVTIEMDLRAPWHHASADAARLQQVFWNLLHNAIKFSEPRGQVLVRTEGDVGDLLRVTVRDFGRGMDASTRERLFSPFEHPATPAGGAPGLGLGLTIARSIVEQHGGLIWAASDGPGHGSTFDVDLFALPAPGGDIPAAAPPQTAGSGRKRRVLLVEDHEDTSELLAMSLAQEGYDVRVATSLAAGLAALDDEWDAVVSDIGLADGSGLEIARRARQLSRRPPQVIALTGYGSESDIAASHAAGFDLHLVKPIDPGQLLRVLSPTSL